LLSGDHIARAEEEHHELLELCRKRNKRAVKSFLSQHIVGVEEDLAVALGI
jgi:DNA-binding GntR family transcriptional regulator